jgi:hypothetical protein
VRPDFGGEPDEPYVIDTMHAECELYHLEKYWGVFAERNYGFLICSYGMRTYFGVDIK